MTAEQVGTTSTVYRGTFADPVTAYNAGVFTSEIVLSLAGSDDFLYTLKNGATDDTKKVYYTNHTYDADKEKYFFSHWWTDNVE